jgi:hypothetical protein
MEAALQIRAVDDPAQLRLDGIRPLGCPLVYRLIER